MLSDSALLIRGFCSLLIVAPLFLTKSGLVTAIALTKILNGFLFCVSVETVDVVTIKSCQQFKFQKYAVVLEHFIYCLTFIEQDDYANLIGIEDELTVPAFHRVSRHQKALG